MNSCFIILLLLFIILFLVVKELYKKKEFFQDPVLSKLIKRVSRVHPEILDFEIGALNNCKLEDSFTERKKKIGICVSDPAGRYYNPNKLTQVIIHELSHGLSKREDIDHESQEFLENYSRLIKKASDEGIIDTTTL